jgi:hypothetical protein
VSIITRVWFRVNAFRRKSVKSVSPAWGEASRADEAIQLITSGAGASLYLSVLPEAAEAKSEKTYESSNAML